MPDRLDRVMAVVTRAKQNLLDFELGLRAYQDSGPYEVRAEEDANAGERIYRVTKLDPVPHELTTIAADVIQNLRSPLDHLAYQLVLDSRGKSPPNWNVYYPICRTAAGYPALRSGYIKGVRQDVVDAIDATEPYKGGKGHALWQLHELNKVPKHMDLLSTARVEDGIDLRRLLPGGPFPNSPHLVKAWDAFPTVFIRPAESRPLNTGDIIDRESIQSEMDKNRKFSIAVTLHAPGIVEREPALKVLHDLAGLVEGIVGTIGKLLL